MLDTLVEVEEKEKEERKKTGRKKEKSNKGDTRPACRREMRCFAQWEDWKGRDGGGFLYLSVSHGLVVFMVLLIVDSKGTRPSREMNVFRGTVTASSNYELLIKNETRNDYT